jgi:hypothetical protein
VGKLANLAAIKTSNSDSFVYVPPDAAFNAARILVKPSLAYGAGHPATVSIDVLGAVLRGLRRVSPLGRILIVEGMTGQGNIHERYESHGIKDILDRETILADAEELLLKQFPNTSPAPAKYQTMLAPGYIEEFDCVISIAPLKRTQLNGEPLISGATKNLYGLLPRHHYQGRSPYSRGQLHVPNVDTVLPDVYFSIGWQFHGAVVDLTAFYDSPDWRPDRVRDISTPVGKVVWGDDMIAVDEAACRLAGVAVPQYIKTINTLRGD